MQDQLTLFAAASRAKTSALPIAQAVRAWAESAAGFGTRSYELSEAFARHGLSSRTSLACFPAIEDVTSQPSSAGWQTAGMVSPTGSLTLRLSASPSDAVESTLSDILETDAPLMYYLSPRQCRGILRRARERGRSIHAALRSALEHGASQTP